MKGIGTVAVLAAVWLGLGCARAPETAPEPEATPGSVAPLVEKAERAERRRDFDTAIAAYRLAFDRTPWNTRLRRALAVAHAGRAASARDEGRLPAAEHDLRQALSLEPEAPELRANLAVVLLERASLDLDEETAAGRRREATELAPDLAARMPEVNASIERRLDLAFELLERGQIDAGIHRLTQLLAERPERRDVRVLLAQAHIRRGTDQSQRGGFDAASQDFDAAVELYRPLGLCDAGGCRREEVRLAHRNRIVALVNGSRRREAARALAEAERLGLRFPDLRRLMPAPGSARP